MEGMASTTLDAETAEELLIELGDSMEPHETAQTQLASATSEERRALRSLYTRIDMLRHAHPTENCLLKLCCASGEMVEFEFAALKQPVKPVVSEGGTEPPPFTSEIVQAAPQSPVARKAQQPVQEALGGDYGSPRSEPPPLPSCVTPVVATRTAAKPDQELATTRAKRGRSTSALLASPPLSGSQALLSSMRGARGSSSRALQLGVTDCDSTS